MANEKGINWSRVGRVAAGISTLGASEVALGAIHYGTEAIDRVSQNAMDTAASMLPSRGGSSSAPVSLPTPPEAGTPPETEAPSGEGENAFDMEEYMSYLFGGMERIQGENRAAMPGFMSSMMDQAQNAAGEWDDAMQSAMAGLGITPEEIIGGMQTAMGVSKSLMAGQLPQPYIDQMASYRAEKYPAYVTNGPMFGAADMRAYGYDVMSGILRGTEMFPQQAAQTMALGQQFIPGTMNLGQLYSQNLSLMAPYYFTQPSAILGPLASGYQTGAQIGLGYDQLGFQYAQMENQDYWNQQQMDFSNYWGQLNYQRAIAQDRMQMEMFNRQMAAQRRQQNLNLGLGILTAGTSILTGGLFKSPSMGASSLSSYSSPYSSTTPYFGAGSYPSGYSYAGNPFFGTPSGLSPLLGNGGL